ncbi:MAG: glutamyl-tRNA reductase [Desulfobulbus propionicus]|nr:MAG: glutamyl-tRNA reductase [Desulfobulbus propionicus]
MPHDSIVLLGVNHKTTPLAVREKLALSGEYEEALLALGKLDAVKECFLLSTCNRVEVLFTSEEPVSTSDKVLDVLFAGRMDKQELGQYVYNYVNEDAIGHLFMVASSLDSMIVGEAQILGQLKHAYRHAAQTKSSGYVLNKLLHKAFSVAKRVRTETNIGASAVSISYAAVELARKIFGDLQDKKVLLIGAGEMAELAAEHLVGQGVAEVVVANRTLKNALTLARCFNGRAVDLGELLEQLEQVDIVISSTGAPGLILTKEDVRSVMRERRNRPLFFIDIAVPRDLDAKINELGNVYLYDIDELKNVVEMNKCERDREAVKGERIVAEEKLKFNRWLENLVATPTIIELRNMIDEVVRIEVDKTTHKLKNQGASEEQLKSIEKMAAAIANKLMHSPMQYLKAGGEEASKMERISIIRSLFNLDKSNPNNNALT